MIRRSAVGIAVLAAMRVGVACTGEDPELGPEPPDAGADSAADGATSDGPVQIDPTYPGDPGAVSELYVAGGRLRPLFDETAFGVKRFVAWWDSTLQLPCSFRFFSEEDGYLCMPVTSTFARTSTTFADSACTRNVAVQECSRFDSDHVIVIDDTFCPPRARVTVRTEEVAQFHRKRLGDDYCDTTPVPATGSIKAYSYKGGLTTGGFDMKSLVAAKVAPISTGDGKTVAYKLQTAEGAEQFLELRAAGVGTCRVTAYANELRCLPARPPNYTDNSTNLVLFANGASGTCSDLVRPVALRRCGETYAQRNPTEACEPELRAIRDPLNQYFLRAGNLCAPSPPLTNVYRTDNVLEEASVFPAAQPVPLLEGVRLQPLRYRLSEGLRGEIPDRYWDGDLKSECRFGTTKDGKTRCIPDAVLPLTKKFYEDAACTKELTEIVAYDATCLSEPARFAYREIPGTAPACIDENLQHPPAQRELFELGPRRTAPAFEKNTFGTCIAASTSIAPIGIEVDPARLVELVPAKR